MISMIPEGYQHSLLMVSAGSNNNLISYVMQVDLGNKQQKANTDLVQTLHVDVKSQEADDLPGHPTSSLPPVSPISKVCSNIPDEGKVKKIENKLGLSWAKLSTA